MGEVQGQVMVADLNADGAVEIFAGDQSSEFFRSFAAGLGWGSKLARHQQSRVVCNGYSAAPGSPHAKLLVHEAAPG
jgi:hypothetical protein